MINLMFFRSMTGVSATTAGSTLVVGLIGVLMIWLGGRAIIAGDMTLGDRIVIMRDGWIQQAGRPLDLYDRPTNVFVAAFIGSPEMNLVEGDLLRDGGGLKVRSGELQLGLPDSFRSGANVTDSAPAILLIHRRLQLSGGLDAGDHRST